MAESKRTTNEQRVLHHGQPSVRPRVVEPVVIKHSAVFLLCTATGDVLSDTEQGLYYHDMRYLCGQTLLLDGLTPVPLLADSSPGGSATFEMTNPDLEDDDGIRVRKETLGIRREKHIGRTYTEKIMVDNYAGDRAEFVLSLAYEADFVDMFTVRGVHPKQRGTLHKPEWRKHVLSFRYDGADGHERSTSVRFSRDPDQRQGTTAVYHVVVEAKQRWELMITSELVDHAGDGTIRQSDDEAQTDDVVGVGPEAVTGGMEISTSNTLFDQILQRSFKDLTMLTTYQHGQRFFAAGVPWYVALFGRDSLVTAIEIAAYNPSVAAHTLRALASHQGDRVDDWRDEQPGKILHELRVGEMANLDEVPQTPYYGSIDSTLLFLILMGIQSAWTGTLDLFRELRDNVKMALAWIDNYADTDGDGLIDYHTRSPKGLRNQGWKDSGNGIVMEDGSLAEPPIALPEVQGEAYLAWMMIADLYQRDGDRATAQALRERASKLRAAFNRGFWLPDLKYFALCRQADGRFSRSIASNPAHALWTGIVDARHARSVVRRVLADDMFTGWGVRTLSSGDRSYNPVDYQVGTVWPQDNAFIVAGMHRYGFTAEAGQVFTGMMEAASQFEHFRLPETFAGYDRGYSARPVPYPVACSPQAWAAGAIPYMLQTALGLHPDAFNARLRVERPRLPEWLDWVIVKGLRVGDAELDLRYERSGASTLIAVLNKHGSLTVTVEY